MVGYDSHDNNQVNTVHFAIAGATSGFITRVATQPLDVLKIRFQLQIEPLSSNCKSSKYTGINQAWKCIIKEEGITALWKGLISAQFLSVVYGIVQFSSFEYFTKVFWLKLNDKKYEHAINWFSGSLAGATATFSAHPFDVIRTRLVAQSEPKTYLSNTHAFVNIVRKERLKGLYRGLFPALVQIVPYTGAAFCVNGICNNVWESFGSFGSKKDPTAIQSLICGGIAGVTAKVIVYPLDLVKKRMQVQGFNNARQSFGKTVNYSGLFDCLIKVVKMESFLGLYKGLYPSLIKAGASSALNFAVYEQIMKIMKLKYKHK
ncbi:mitochondrial thiamine pyrophosphate carrier-like protein [Leptotrombidium deliense]|uniref:Mitochondrial thiamine pyrophosphate carrier n=1 Tax=Leptotrombidium deliense TaxID=299467 RepID=A0A443SWY5_9ACAR|nr:mitochondrial thiamine pyrophosphate carrier-like protein [Leptotrombidium deliense]